MSGGTLQRYVEHSNANHVLFLVILHDDGLGRFTENSHWIHHGFTNNSPLFTNLNCHNCSQITNINFGVVEASPICIGGNGGICEQLRFVNNRNCADKCASNCWAATYEVCMGDLRDLDGGIKRPISDD